MKRRLMVLFLSLSAATVFAAGQKEEPPQKVLYRILSTAKEGNAKAVDEEFAPISVDILPAVLYEEEASRRGGENGQVNRPVSAVKKPFTKRKPAAAMKTTVTKSR